MKDSFKLKVLDSLIAEFGSNEYPNASEDELFERFAITEILKPKSLLPEAIEDGIVDGSKDGGVDAVFTFLNGALLSEDSPYLTPNSAAVKNLPRQPLLEVVLIQSKNKEKWEESAWSRLLSSLPSFLDPEADDEDLVKVYNGDVVAKTGIYRWAMRALAVKFPKIKASIYYATRAPEVNVSTSMKKIQQDLERTLKKDVLADAELVLSHAGISWLYEKSDEEITRVGTLSFADLIRTDNAFIGTVTLENYLNFLAEEDGHLTQSLFEANVRDYEGANRVNESIAKTLESQDDVEFWWRNNGITILANAANCPTNTMTLEQPYIVNGLQTSYVLMKALETKKIDSGRLKERIIIRVIVSDNDEIRDAVISGTNMQTAISSESLYASDAIQNDIERFFLAHGWYYERRKNYYKNQSKPAGKRISIVYLSQAVMTLALGEPHTARARPNTLLTQEGGYERVFNEAIDCDAYLVAARILKEVDDYLKTEEAKQIFEERTNARFYVALTYYTKMLNIDSLAELHFAENASRVSFPLDKSLLKESLQDIANAFASFPEEPNDRLSKRQDFTDTLFGSKDIS